MLDTLFEIASTLFFATLAGCFIWFVLSDGDPLTCFKPKKPQLCDQCKFRKRKFSREHGMYTYVCDAETDRGEEFYTAPTTCKLFEERSTNDPQMDT